MSTELSAAERLLEMWQEHLTYAEHAVEFAKEQVAHYAGLIAVDQQEHQQI